MEAQEALSETLTLDYYSEEDKTSFMHAFVDKRDKVTSLYFSKMPAKLFDKAEWQYLLSAKSLKKLSFDSSVISNIVFELINKNIEELRLKNLSVFKAKNKAIKCKGLDEKELDFISKFHSLKVLHLENNENLKKGVLDIIAKIPSLLELSVIGCPITLLDLSKNLTSKLPSRLLRRPSSLRILRVNSIDAKQHNNEKARRSFQTSSLEELWFQQQNLLS